MAWAAAIAGILGAGGQVAGGLLGQEHTPDPRTTRYDPGLDLALQASQYDALNQLGFGNISNVPGPYEQLIARINAQPKPSKNRRQIIAALNNIRGNPSLLDDPFGKNFTEEQLREAFRSGVPQDRIGEWSKDSSDWKKKSYAKLPVENMSLLNRALKSMGMNIDQLKTTLTKDAEHQAQIKRLEEAGLGKLNEQTILNRANAAATAAQLTGGAADFARTGQVPTDGIGRDLYNVDEQQMQKLTAQLGLQANFGGINPAQLFETMTDRKLNQNLRLIEQQLGMSSAISAALNPGLAAGAGAAAASTGASMNAAQIAAAQAQAANQLRAQSASNNATSMGNGAAGALGSLGSAIGNYGMLSQLGQQNQNYSAGFNQTDQALANTSDVTGYRW